MIIRLRTSYNSYMCERRHLLTGVGTKLFSLRVAHILSTYLVRHLSLNNKINLLNQIHVYAKLICNR